MMMMTQQWDVFNSHGELLSIDMITELNTMFYTMAESYNTCP